MKDERQRKIRVGKKKKKKGRKWHWVNVWVLGFLVENKTKAAFVSAVKSFRKIFYTTGSVWVVSENSVKQKMISVDCKPCPKTL